MVVGLSVWRQAGGRRRRRGGPVHCRGDLVSLEGNVRVEGEVGDVRVFLLHAVAFWLVRERKREKEKRCGGLDDDGSGLDFFGEKVQLQLVSLSLQRKERMAK